MAGNSLETLTLQNFRLLRVKHIDLRYKSEAILYPIKRQPCCCTQLGIEYWGFQHQTATESIVMLVLMMETEAHRGGHQLMCLHHFWLKHTAEVTCTISQVNTSPRMTLLRQVHQVRFQVF